MVQYIMKYALLMISTCAASYLREASPVTHRELQSLPSIDDVIMNDPNLTTLALAFESAGLVGRLCTVCNFTVFAPVNEAFAAVDQKFLATLLTPSWVLHLQDLLASHVTLPTDDGLRLLSTDYRDGQIFEMLNSEFVTAIDLKRGITLTTGSMPTVGSNIIEADVIASNGVVQKVDAVFPPRFSGVDVFALGDSFVEFTILQELMDLIGLAGTAGEFTVLAPINEAFLALGNETLAALKEDKKALGQVLANHIIVGVFPSMFLTNGLVLESMSGLQITVTISAAIARQVATAIQFNNSTAIVRDILAINGIVYAIDTVIAGTDPMSSTPTTLETSVPSEAAIPVPSAISSSIPSSTPSSVPSDVPSSLPSDTPSDAPSAAPSTIP